MDRKISFADVQKAVEEAYEQFKSLSEGSVDPRVADTADADAFGISVVLADGRFADKGDADTLFVLGAMAKLPLSAVLLSQNPVSDLVKKSGHCACCCHGGKEKSSISLPFGRHGIKAVSAVEPQGDREGKMKVISDMLVGMSGCEPVFDDGLYEKFQAEIAKADVVGQLENSGYKLMDSADLSVDIYVRLMSLKMSAKQLATMGATVAADGRNPYSAEYAFDGEIAPRIVAMMATRGKHFIKPWMVLTGMPAVRSFAGVMLAVLPGFGAIAAYSPKTDDRGTSVKASKAISYIAGKLCLNVFSSARVDVEK